MDLIDTLCIQEDCNLVFRDAMKLILDSFGSDTAFEIQKSFLTSTAPPPRVITVSVTARAPVIARARNEARRLGDLLESQTAPSLYTATAQTESLVAELVNGFDSTGAANRAMRMEGSWRVFYAPHIFRLSQMVRAHGAIRAAQVRLGGEGAFL